MSFFTIKKLLYSFYFKSVLPLFLVREFVVSDNVLDVDKALTRVPKLEVRIGTYIEVLLYLCTI